MSRITVMLRDLYPVTLFHGARGSVVVKALRFKPAGRGFDWNFSVT